MIDITHKEIEESDTICIDGIEFQKVKHGKWIDVEHAPNDMWYCTCSECGERQTVEIAKLIHFNYCPYCGAKMDAKEEENA